MKMPSSSIRDLKQRHVVIVGPELFQVGAAYGGGSGGYTRNMAVYLNHFDQIHYRMTPCFYTVRKKAFGFSGLFIVRFVRDMWRFILCILKVRPEVAHVLAQYRTAVPRELGYMILCKLFNISFVYEIKAGAFDVWYCNSGILIRGMVRCIMNSSDLILVEGERYLGFISTEFKRESIYFPNHVPDVEILESVEPLFVCDELRMVFIGYCYSGKGVYELVEGCNLAAISGVKISLTLVGEEEGSFADWLDQLQIHTNLTLSRLGKQSHEKALEILNEADVFCLPSKHTGEGHNNSVNEAMMLGKCLIISQAGFLRDILSEDEAYFLKEVSAAAVADCIKQVNSSHEDARIKASRSRDILLAKYTTGVLHAVLVQQYNKIQEAGLS